MPGFCKGSRDDVACGCRAEPAKLAVRPPAKAASKLQQQTKVLRFIADRQSPPSGEIALQQKQVARLAPIAARRTPNTQAERLALHSRQAVTRRRRNRTQKSKTGVLRQNRVKGGSPLRVQGRARETCRQATRRKPLPPPPISKPNGLRSTAGRRSHAEGKTTPNKSKSSDLRFTAVRQAPPPQGVTYPHTASQPACRFSVSPVLFPLCAAFRFFLSSLPFCPRPTLSESSLRSALSPPAFPEGQGHIIET